MKKTLRTLLLAALMVLTLCATALAEDATYQVTYSYDESVCELEVTDPNNNGAAVASGGAVIPGSNGVGKVTHRVKNVADGWRIKDLVQTTENGVTSYAESFIVGSYGYITIGVGRNVDYVLEMEKVPAVLPAVQSVALCTEKDGTAVKTVTFTEDSKKLYANVMFSENVPDYFAFFNWQYSTDGETWADIPQRTNDASDFSARTYGDFDFLNAQDYYLRVSASGRDLYSTSDAVVYSEPVLINPSSGDSGDSGSMAVTNVRFQDRFGLPYLYWDVPVEKSDEVYYVAYLSADNGATFKRISGTRSEKAALHEVAPGVYNAVKIVTQVNWEDVAECIVTDLTLTIKDGGMLAAPSVTAAEQEDGRYIFSVSGLPANTMYWFGMEDESGIGVGTSLNTDENGAFNVTYGANDMESFLEEDMGYVLQEFTDITVSADGKSAAMTISDRGGWTKLSTLFGGEDTEPGNQTGYGVGLEVWNNIFFVNPIVPAGTDEEQMYDIYLYSSETGNSFGNTQFYLGGGVVVPDVAGTYDRAKLIKTDSQDVLADVELEKPVIASFTLEVPAGVTVSRTEINETTDQYTVKGIDLNKYGYELSPDGYGGKNLSEETFTISKNYYGDLTTAYVQIFSAVEKEDAYYLDRSPYATVTVNGGSSEETTVSGTVSNGSGASIEINGQSVQVNEDGSFEIPAEGTFDVAIKKGGCLTYTIKGVSAENGNVELPEVVLVAGDVNEDGKINIQDMGTFRAEFGKTGDAIGNDYTDVNEDGKVNIQDMGTFRANFGKTAEKDCTVEYGA